MARRTARREFRRRLWQQLPLLLVLVILWMLLWGEVSLLSVAAGLLVAVVVVVVFYLPPVALSGRLNLFWLLVYLAGFLTEMVIASFQVAWYTLRPAKPPMSSVVAVQLQTRSDFVTTLVAITLSLIPGSIVVEVDRARSILYLHVFGTDDQAAVDRFREKSLFVERRIVWAVGSRDDLERIRR